MPLSQGYLTNGSGEAEVRLRRAGERLLMTVKTGSGEVREQIEVTIEAELFERLWPLTDGRRVTKTRRRARLGEGLEAEVDVYEGDLSDCSSPRSSSPAPARAPPSTHPPGSAARSPATLATRTATWPKPARRPRRARARARGHTA